MPSETSPHAGPLVTLDAIRAEHSRMLELDPAGAAAEAEFVLEVRRFVDQLVASGVYFDEMSERRTIQAYLDHWIGELSSRARPEERSALTQLELRAFSVEALRGLQDTVVNPFATVAADLRASTEAAGLSATAILKWMEERAKAGGVRCQEGLLKEIANQIAADPEGPTLLEFCLWHLFEDPATRIGNKIRRREGEVAFSCSAYLVEKTASLYERQGEPEQRAMMRALLAFSHDDAPGARERSIPRQQIAGGGDSHQFELYGRHPADLERFLLDARIVFAGVGDRLLLVHRTLLTHWPQLAAAKGQQLERKRWIRRVTIGGSLVVAAISVTSIAWWAYATRQAAIAIQSANEATVRGGMALSYVRSLKPYYDSAPADSEDAYNAAVGQAIWQAGVDHVTQLTRATEALEARAGPVEKTVGNDALAGAIAFLAQASAVGRLEPQVIRCTAGRRCLHVGGDVLDIPEIPESAQVGEDAAKDAEEDDYKEDAAAAVNHDATRFVQIWSLGEQTVLGVYGIDASAKPRPTIHFLRSVPLGFTCDARNAVVRFSGDGRVVTVRCRDDSDSWSLVDIDSPDRRPSVRHSPGVSLEQIKALVRVEKLRNGENVTIKESDHDRLKAKVCNGLLTLPARSAAVYPASLGDSKAGRSYVTTNGVGDVRLWAEDDDCPRAQFSSGFVRMDTWGAPAGLAFQQSDVARYAIYRTGAGLPPLIRIYEQSSPSGAELIAEHYPPMGTPVSMRFTPTGKCLEVRTKVRKPRTARKDQDYLGLRYYISTEAPALTALTRALVRDLEAKDSVNASQAQQAKDWRAALPRYSAAVDEQCGLTQAGS